MEGEVKNMRAPLAAVCALVVLAGCGRAQFGGVPSSGDYKLYEAASTQSSQLVSVIDSRSHSVERSLPLGTPSPDWGHLYLVRSTPIDRPDTLPAKTLLDVDPKTGATLRVTQLPGYFQLPSATMSGVPGGLSQDGHWLVLEAFDTTSNGLPSATHLVLVDTSYSRPLQRVDLTGYFQFDAVSNDGLRIYLIQYVSSTEYYVRFYDVGMKALDPTFIFDKSDGGAAMAGLRLSGVASPDGHWLYSVYNRQDKGAFIHALSMDNAIAFCIDLPGSGYATSTDGFRWSLALSRDGSHLYAANGAMGIVADVSTGGNGLPSITRTVHIDSTGPTASIFAQDVQAKEFGAYDGAVLSPDGRTLVMAGATGIVWLDTATLHAQSRQLTNWAVWGLALSPDGSMLYAVNDAGNIAEMSMTGKHLATTFSGAPGQPLALIRVEAAQAP
jgi:hypothetical protein